MFIILQYMINCTMSYYSHTSSFGKGKILTQKQKSNFFVCISVYSENKKIEKEDDMKKYYSIFDVDSKSIVY